MATHKTGEKHRAVEENSSESALARAVNLLERSVNLLKESAHANDSTLDQLGNNDQHALAIQNRAIVNYR